MQISIKQQEITAAVRAFIVAQGINLDGKEFSVKYTAGRGTDGLTADIEILNKDMPDLIDDDASAAVATTAIATAAGKGKSVLKAVVSDKKAPAEEAPVEPAKGTEPEVTGGVTDDGVAATVGTPAQEEAAAPKSTTPSLFS